MDEDTAFEPPRAKLIYQLLNELRHIRGFTQTLASIGWDDHDNQSPDLNTARLRAKYYGAEYMMSRPFLHHAIHCTAAEKIQLNEAWNFASTLPIENFNIFQKPQNIPPSVDERALRTIFACHKCITAAFNSTYAFDKVEGRLMITNIFGTMHA